MKTKIEPQNMKGEWKNATGQAWGKIMIKSMINIWYNAAVRNWRFGCAAYDRFDWKDKVDSPLAHGTDHDIRRRRGSSYSDGALRSNIDRRAAKIEDAHIVAAAALACNHNWQVATHATGENGTWKQLACQFAARKHYILLFWDMKDSRWVEYWVYCWTAAERYPSIQRGIMLLFKKACGRSIQER